MSQVIQISVVIPTLNRAGLLRLTLESLARQTVALERVEVVVVVDGGTDESAAVVDELSALPLIRRVDLPRSGRAVARNRGAAAARGEIICFLDDDMEASPGFLEAHLRAHSQNPGGVVLGYFPIYGGAVTQRGATEYLSEWWGRQFAVWSEPDHKFTFRDFCTGNVSMPKRLFQETGGFDESFPPSSAGEDWEFGHRLIKSGAKFSFAKDALSFHRCRLDWQYLLNRAREEGRGHVVIATRHPDLQDQLELRRLVSLTRNSLTRPLLLAAWTMPFVPDAAARLLKFASRLFLAAGFQRAYRHFHRLLWGYNYWLAVRSAIPSWPAWKALAGLGTTGAPLNDAAQPEEQFR